MPRKQWNETLLSKTDPTQRRKGRREAQRGIAATKTLTVATPRHSRERGNDEEGENDDWGRFFLVIMSVPAAANYCNSCAKRQEIDG